MLHLKFEYLLSQKFLLINYHTLYKNIQLIYLGIFIFSIFLQSLEFNFMCSIFFIIIALILIICFQPFHLFVVYFHGCVFYDKILKIQFSTFFLVNKFIEI
jgi:hypothetical protein